MTIVAISREMGSRPYEIGAAVAKALNFDYVDRQILLEAAAVVAQRIPGVTTVSCEAEEIPRVFPSPIV